MNYRCVKKNAMANINLYIGVYLHWYYNDQGLNAWITYQLIFNCLSSNTSYDTQVSELWFCC